MDYNILLCLADKYGISYDLEQAVLVQSFQSFLEELEYRINEFQYTDMEYYERMTIKSSWTHYPDLFIPDEVIDVLGEEEAISCLNDFLDIDYQDLFNNLDSGKFWDFYNIEPSMKNFLITNFAGIESDDYNRFSVSVSIPSVYEVIDAANEDLIDLLDLQTFYKKTEELDKIIAAVQDEDAAALRKTIKASCFNTHIEEYTIDSILLQNAISYSFKTIKELNMLNAMLPNILKISDDAYKALDIAQDYIFKFLKDSNDTYSSPSYWLDFFEANGMAEAKWIRKILEKQ